MGDAQSSPWLSKLKWSSMSHPWRRDDFWDTPYDLGNLRCTDGMGFSQSFRLSEWMSLDMSGVTNWNRNPVVIKIYKHHIHSWYHGMHVKIPPNSWSHGLHGGHSIRPATAPREKRATDARNWNGCVWIFRNWVLEGICTLISDTPIRWSLQTRGHLAATAARVSKYWFV